ncbi:MAG: hypothetical protein OXL37_17325 [Chloroflexota bacterium]|nr:hypothetical protein [Chloroflexota bacterium]MDE2788400.1 hypothetical protein [Chloroflexota bacterium]MDE2960922.1 hypothetical protein [Chloroflexota bacterium]
MVFAAIFRQKTRKEGREEGRVEGREEGREEGRKEGQAVGREEADAAWREWNQRRLQAMAEGIPFDEPTPDLVRGTSPPDSEQPSKPPR